FGLARIERADARFLDGFATTRLYDAAAARALGADDDAQTRHSALRRVFAAGIGEWTLDAQPAPGARAGTGMGVGLIEAVRAGVEAALVHETERLNARLVVLTLAVSGGPFLGLLGTVLGVMITFASIAAQGEVNVNTIAPGVAAALTTTVMGLVVAIPAMFGYNYLAGRITRRIAGMEVFAEQLLSRLARQLASVAPGA
ncbi:MAG: MotA/TolQ/ExbB proton channel family protein, partial [Gammaproteobacteria bacterium]